MEALRARKRVFREHSKIFRVHLYFFDGDFDNIDSTIGGYKQPFLHCIKRAVYIYYRWTPPLKMCVLSQYEWVL